MTDLSHEFGDGCGPVPAHRHPNGGGWVADSACVHATAYVAPEAAVGSGCEVAELAAIEGATVLVHGSHIGRGAHVMLRPPTVLR